MTAPGDAGIAAVGHYVPRLRVTAKAYREAWGAFGARGVERMAVPAFDEDAATLAIEAAVRALRAWGGDAADLALVAFATGGGDAAAATVAEALGASRARALDVTGRPTAGVSALATAFDHANARNAPALVVAADVPRGAPGAPEEQGAGAGAAAFVIAPGGAVRLLDTAAETRDFPGDRWTDENGYAREGGLDLGQGDVLARVLARVDLRGLAFAAAPRPLEATAKPADLAARMGNAGAAHPLLELVQALHAAEPKGRGLVAADGAGALALVLEARARPAGDLDVAALLEGGEEVSVLRAIQERGRLLGDLALPEEPMGAHVPFPDYADTLGARYRLEAQRCEGCDALQLPPKPRCARCGGARLAPERLSGRGEVYAYTIIGRGGAPSEFAAQQAMTGAYPVAVVELEEGPRVSVQLADVSEDDLRVGLPVRAAFRRLYRQQGVVRYGLKFVPAP